MRTTEDVRWDIHFHEQAISISKDALKQAERELSRLEPRLEALYEELFAMLDKEDEDAEEAAG